MPEKPTPESLNEKIKNLEQRVARLEQENGQLLADNEVLRLIIEQCPYSIQIYHKDGTLLEANKAWEKLWGLRAADTVGKFNALQDEQAKALGAHEAFNRVLSGEQLTIPPLEYTPRQACMSSGRSRWVSRFFYPLQEKNGNIERFALIEEDFTEYMQNKEILEKNHGKLERQIQQRTAELLKTSQALQHAVLERQQAEIEVEKKHRQLLSIFDSIDEIIYVCDTQSHELLYANKALVKAFGDIRGAKCYQVLQGEQAPCSFCNNERILGENFGKTHYRNFQNRINGRLYRCIDKAIKWPDGRIARYEMAIDITEQARMEKKFGQVQKMEALGTLAAGMAHDFNNILNIITGHTEQIKSLAGDNQPLQDKVNGILRAADRAAQLVRQTLTFSHQAKQNKQNLRLQPLIKEGLKLQENILPDNVELRADLAWDQWVISSNPVAIHQIVANLITNASQAMTPRGGTITVTLEDAQPPRDISSSTANETFTENYVKFSVSDTGEGIPPQIIDKIFDPYFSTKEQGQGTGLGLAIVHGIVKDHGGQITVDSVPGQGTVFSIYFPLRAEAAPQVTQSEISARPPLDGQLSILYVDDEWLNIMCWRLNLEELGFKVTGHTSPLEALEEFRRHPLAFDLVITDQKMPDLTGIELAAQLTRIRADIPIILISGWTDAALKEQAAKNGVKNILMKPHDMEQLSEAIRAVTGEDDDSQQRVACKN